MRVGEQLAFPLRGRGGPGRGQGRKKRARGVAHARRPTLSRHHPVHVSTRVLSGLPSLRGRKLWKAVRRALQVCCQGEEFRIVQFSVQGQHIHLLCEASDRRALSRGIQGFKTSVARRVNRACGRRGTVFQERYHQRIITTPAQAWYALAYVLNNQRHHGYEQMISYRAGHVDPRSSARWFDGWIGGRPPLWREGEEDEEDGAPLVAAATTWLLTVGWRERGRGLISPDFIPALPKGAPPLPVW